MSSEFLDERRNGLEEAFFAEQDRELKERLRAKQERADELVAMTQASGISDAALLEQMLDSGVGAAALSAVSLLPLVLVAWADGTMDAGERDAILKASHDAGIAPDSDAGEVLGSWLAKRPGPEVKDAWKGYVHALVETIGADKAAAMKTDVMGRAKGVAEAAGGFLGIATISDLEKQMLEELEASFG